MFLMYFSYDYTLNIFVRSMYNGVVIHTSIIEVTGGL